MNRIRSAAGRIVHAGVAKFGPYGLALVVALALVLSLRGAW